MENQLATASASLDLLSYSNTRRALSLLLHLESLALTCRLTGITNVVDSHEPFAVELIITMSKLSNHHYPHPRRAKLVDVKITECPFASQLSAPLQQRFAFLLLFHLSDKLLLFFR